MPMTAIEKSAKVPHRFGPHTTVYELDFHVGYGSERICLDCGAKTFENWCDTRASGGIERMVEAGDGSCVRKAMESRPAGK